MTSVDCRQMPRQRNKDFVHNYVITHRENEKNAMQIYILMVLIPKMSTYMDRRSIISVLSCFSQDKLKPQDVFNDDPDNEL